MAYNHDELYSAASKGSYEKLSYQVSLKPMDENIDRFKFNRSALFKMSSGTTVYPYKIGYYKGIISLLMVGANPYLECTPEELKYPSNSFLAAVERGDLAVARLMVMRDPNYEVVKQFSTKKEGQVEYPSRSIQDVLIDRDSFETRRGKPNRHFAQIISETANDAREIKHQEVLAQQYTHSGNLIKAVKAYEAIIALYAKQAKLEMVLHYYKPREFARALFSEYDEDVLPEDYRIILRDHYLGQQQHYLAQLYTWYTQIEEHLQNNSAAATQADKVYHVYVLGRLIEIGSALSFKDKAILNTFAQREIALRDTMSIKPDFSSIPDGPEGIIFSVRAPLDITMHDTDDEDIGLTTGRPKRDGGPISSVLKWLGMGVSDTSTAETKYVKDR